MKAMKLSSSLATRTLGRSQTRLVRLAKSPVRAHGFHTQQRASVGSRFTSAAFGFAGVAMVCLMQLHVLLDYIIFIG